MRVWIDKKRKRWDAHMILYQGLLFLKWSVALHMVSIGRKVATVSKTLYSLLSCHHKDREELP